MQKFKRIMRMSVFYALIPLIASGYSFTVLAEDPAALPPAYTYDPTTSHWNTDGWVFDSASGTYKPKPVPATPSETSPTSNQAPVPVNNDPSGTNVGTTTNTTNNTVGVENNNTSTATSGNAGVTNNTSAGNASSGNAAASTTVVNTVHSTTQGDTLGVAHFTSDIYGNVTGDITLSSTIDNLPAQPSNADAKTIVNNAPVVTNNIAVTAGSGDATVSHNTDAGNATTGSAHAVANVINLINSIIAANKSFIGTINIYGNLNGDILISPEFIPQLIASNKQDANSSVASEDNQSIINNVHLSATSGNAVVSGNTSAGQATTGTAATNLTVLNLSGHHVVASNSLLVFVNVLGTWVGIIVDAPGATAAMLGSGVTSNSGNGSQDIASTNNSQITNNIDVSASSGNANVTDNTHAGNATSGNTTASANILNVITDDLSLSDWFGVLYINVFGNWNGSFGVDTASGDPPPLSPPPPQTTQQTPSVRVGFRDHTSSGQQVATNSGTTDGSNNEDPQASVLGASNEAADPPTSTSKNTQIKPPIDLFMLIPAALLLLAVAAALLNRRNSRVGFATHT